MQPFEWNSITMSQPVPTPLSEPTQEDNFRNRLVYVFWFLYSFRDQEGDKDIDHNFP